MVQRFVGMFECTSTLKQYLKHLRWAHRFFHLRNDWDTDELHQMIRGAEKATPGRPQRLALTTKTVKKMSQLALAQADVETATLMALSRVFMLRVPSEGIPLQWSGSHSAIELLEASVKITLVKRKNSKGPVTLTRPCICQSTGESLCPVHLLRQLRSLHSGPKVFTFTTKQFMAEIRDLAASAGHPEASRVGTHAFRRGMAQDILDNGGTLATLLRSGGWTSSAYQEYLRSEQVQDTAVAKFLMVVSESDEE
jgi:hypothetical protein